ncbi:MAG: hypothetical protein ACFFDI_03225 [Promethearchaeota archaeon]
MNIIIKTPIAPYFKFMINNFLINRDKLIKNLFKSVNTYDLSAEDLELIYAFGYYLFTYGKYEMAKEIFTGLTGYAPYTSSYWRALGAVNQQLKNYVEAISAYEMAIANDPSDVICYVYRAESQFLLGKKEEGLADLTEVLEMKWVDPQLTQWVQRAKFLLRLNQ